MGGNAGKRLENWVIKIESSERRHQTIILSTIAERAQRLFEERGCKPGFELDDWLAAEKELWRNEFDGSTCGFRFLVDCCRNPEVTTILSVTAHSLVVFHSLTRHAGEANCGSDVQSVHLFLEEIDPAHAEVKAADGVLHFCVPKKNHPTPSARCCNLNS